MNCTSRKTLEELLVTYGISDYEVTDKHYGNSYVNGWVRLKIIYVYDRFISDAHEFNLLGYGIVRRTRKL